MRSGLWVVRSLKTSASLFFFQMPGGGDGGFRCAVFGHGPVRALSGYPNVRRGPGYPPLTSGTTIEHLSLRSYWGTYAAGGSAGGCGSIRHRPPCVFSARRPYCAWSLFSPLPPTRTARARWSFMIAATAVVPIAPQYLPSKCGELFGWGYPAGGWASSGSPERSFGGPGGADFSSRMKFHFFSSIFSNT